MKKYLSRLLYYRKSDYKLNRLTLQISDPEIQKNYDDFRQQNYKDLALPTAALATFHFIFRLVMMFIAGLNPSVLLSPGLSCGWSLLNLIVVKISPKLSPYFVYILLVT